MLTNKKTNFNFKSEQGFTLIELLIVIALIAIIASVAFVALNPLQRFQDSRDSTRWGDISAILSAIKIDQVDNGGSLLTAITAETEGVVYMIGTGSNCQSNTTCVDVTPGSETCINLTGLVDEGYLAEVPISPNGSESWSASYTGYTLMASTSGSIKIQACEGEGGSAISIIR